MIILEEVSAGYGDHVAIKDITLKFSHPFFAIVAGPNGAGKSTLLKVIIGLIKRRSGRVSIFGVDPEVDKRSIRSLVSYMPQSSTVSPEIPLKVWDIVASPLKLEGIDDEDAVDEAMKVVGIERYAHERFSKLSGGLRQRVLIARALVKPSKLVLLDEPLSHIDPKGRAEIISTLHKIHKERDVSFLIVGHDLSACAMYDPQVILLNRKIIAVGRFSEVVKPRLLAEAYGSLLYGEGFVFMGEEHG
ncbi:MAG: metal ABC transporter ATP-binding protein [Desulfurococcales archaeon]|jgi:ABC-type Mn2+/Zn2+ transport system ATPase subunit|nr:metal ABC transporter ATP-binding protein [Desulfurococcales archaeon]